MNDSAKTNGNDERFEASSIRTRSELGEVGTIRSSPAVPIGSADFLGEPLSIRDVAALLGCSAWTVRQRYLPQGLPHLRACSGGRIVFFREQVVAWILKRQQQKGGSRK